MRFVMWGVRLLKISTSRVLLQDSPPVGSQSVVHLGFTAPLSGLGVGRLSLCSKALWRLSPQMVHCMGVSHSLAIWALLRQRRHRRAFIIHCVRSSRDFAAKATHSDRSCAPLS